MLAASVAGCTSIIVIGGCNNTQGGRGADGSAFATLSLSLFSSIPTFSTSFFSSQDSMAIAGFSLIDGFALDCVARRGCLFVNNLRSLLLILPFSGNANQSPEDGLAMRTRCLGERERESVGKNLKSQKVIEEKCERLSR